MSIQQSIVKQAGEIKRENIPFYMDIKEFKKLVKRIAGKEYADKIVPIPMASKSGFDEYELYDEADKIVIKATSGSAAGVAFNKYLQDCCRYYVGMLNTNGTLPKIPPKVGKKVSNRSLYHYRYFLNYCTFGYTYTFYRWTDWEKVLDRMILSGYNLVLNPLGQECIWRELLLEFGYTESEIEKFLVAPTHMPWLLMMNMEDFKGWYPSWWWQDRVALANKISDRLASFGIGTMLPGYSGMVPSDFAKHFSKVKLKRQGDWCGFERPQYLLYDDTMYAVIAKKFYELQGKMIGHGRVHYYSSDPFHEGGITEGIDLGEFAKKNFSILQEADEKAVWVFQGWGENPRREMLRAIPIERTLITNLLSDSNTNAEDNFLDRPWLYCTVNNFGGQHLLRGGLKKTLEKPYACVHDSKYTMVGIGLMPEAVENGEVFFDIIADSAVAQEQPQIESFIKRYTYLHYGAKNDKLEKAWHILSENIYVKDSIGSSFESAYIACPSLLVDRVANCGEKASNAYPTALLEVAEIYTAEYEKYKKSEAFRFDYVDLVRQLSANYAWNLVYRLQESYRGKDVRTFRKTADLFLKLMDLQGCLLSSEKKFLYANFQKKAYNYGRTKEEKIYFDYLYKTLITVWGDERTENCPDANHRLEGILDNYAAREYGDLIKKYYKPRWEKFISMLEISLLTGKEYKEYNFFQHNLLFGYDRGRYALNAKYDTIKTAKEIISIIKEYKE